MAYDAVKMADWQISEAAETCLLLKNGGINWVFNQMKLFPREDCADWIS
jgi:hypothetical protein